MRYGSTGWTIRLSEQDQRADVGSQYADRWLRNVRSLGGTATQAQTNAVASCIQYWYGAGILDLVKFWCPEGGSDLLAARANAIYPAGNETCSSSGFLAGDYVATSGLIGNTTSKRFQTASVIPYQITGLQLGLATWVTTVATGVSRSLLGVSGSPGAQADAYILYNNGSSQFQGRIWQSTNGAMGAGAAGLWHVVRETDSLSHEYRNGVAQTPDTNLVAPTDAGIPIYTHARNDITAGATSFYGGRTSGHALTTYMTPTQALAFYNGWALFQTGMGR